jgi:ABC-2 type transport system permease protein
MMLTATPGAGDQSTITATLPPNPGRSLATNLLRSEWAKLRSVRSTYWSLLVALGAIIVIGIGAAIAAAMGAARNSSSHTGFDPISAGQGGVSVAQVAVAVLGALAVTSEYSTGMIRSTFIAAPQRGSVIAAKAAVVGIAAAAIGTGAGLVSFMVGQAILGGRGVSLDHPGALRSILGVGVYLGLLGALSVGLGTAIRRTAGAIAVIVGLILVLPALAPLLPSSIRQTVAEYLPYNAGHAIFTTTNSTATLSPWLGLAVFTLYATAALALGVTLVRRRDA